MSLLCGEHRETERWRSIRIYLPFKNGKNKRKSLLSLSRGRCLNTWQFCKLILQWGPQDFGIGTQILTIVLFSTGEQKPVTLAKSCNIWAPSCKKVPYGLSCCHTKRRMGARGRTHCSFGMTPVYCMKSVGALFFDLTYLPLEVISFMIMHFPIEYSEPC